MIKATSTHIKILDGDDLLQGELVPGLKPDVYVFHKTSKQKRVTYYTDIDSISFDVSLGDTHDFAILLNNKDTCFQRITSENLNKVSYLRSNKVSLNDTIPFTLGPNNAIHLKGKINGSDTLDLIFDTGASVGVLSEEGSEKDNALRSDNKNTFEFAGIRIENSPAVFINYHGRLKADGVIGYNAFEDKVVEINYDRGILVIHASMNDVSTTYTEREIIWRGANMFIECVLHNKGKQSKGLFLFDTGSKWALSATKDFAAANQLYGVMNKTGTRRAKGVSGKTIKSTTVTLPTLMIGNLSLENVPLDLESSSNDEGLDKNIVGNDVLKRFNVVIDYRNGYIYLQPNDLVNSAYNKSIDENLIFIGIAVLAAILLFGIFIYRKKRARGK
ncbi:MAG: hypothetical protein WCF67_02435 [Chitinophagaceae bacterium]